MTYQELPYYGYVSFIKRFRAAILGFCTLLIILSAMLIENGFVYNDKSLWLTGSKEYSKLLALQHPSMHVEKAIIDISAEGLTEATIEKLRTLHKNLSAQEHVVILNTLFEQTSMFDNRLNEQQSMMEIRAMLDMSTKEILSDLARNPKHYQNFIDSRHAIFYIVSDKEGTLTTIECSFPYVLTPEQGSSHFKDIMLFSILFVILAGSFTIAFKSFLPTIMGVIFIIATTLLTVALFQWISPAKVTHISIVILAVTVSVMDFIYIYYKWHVMHRRVQPQLVLYRVLSKTFIPVMWTTVTTVVGIGSLMLVDSHILHSMGLNVVLSASVGFVLAFTMLPAMLSYFQQKNPEIVTRDSARYFAGKEAHYEKKHLVLFLGLSGVILAYGIFMYFYKPINVVTDTSATQIRLALKEKDLTYETLLELQNVQNLLEAQFPNDIRAFYSAYTEIDELYKQEHPGELFSLDRIDIDAYTFMFDLYDITKKVLVNEHAVMTIYLHHTENKAQILDFIRSENILYQDQSSLLQIAKMDSINTLFLVVFFVLFIIMSIIYYMTRTWQFVWIALLVNAIPLSWFYAATMLLNIPISTEMLVAMIITVALSSDATMHFIFYYYNNRRKPRSSEKVLETSFLYIGTPLGMGNIMLILTFIALIFVPDKTVSNIGVFSSLLVALSLIMELFVLPVLFLNLIKSNHQLKGYYHGN
jgi:predicted RND superfamily exporter protein